MNRGRAAQRINQRPYRPIASPKQPNKNSLPKQEYLPPLDPKIASFVPTGVFLTDILGKVVPFMPPTQSNFVKYGRRYVDGEFFKCLTCCKEKDNLVICSECASWCHSGHDIVPCTNVGGAFCDCCSGDLESECQIIPKELTRCQCDRANTNHSLKVYECQTCRIPVCEPCAIVCHRKHKLVPTPAGTKCQCGKNNKVLCKVNPINYEILRYHCTREQTGKKYAVQHIYHCRTCNLVDNRVCCENCAKICHVGHDLRDAGKTSAFCDCLEMCQCKLLNLHDMDNPVVSWHHECSCTNNKNPIMQRMIHCETCEITGTKGICEACAQMCHNGHLLRDGGAKAFVCQCESKKLCYLSMSKKLKKCKSMI